MHIKNQFSSHNRVSTDKKGCITVRNLSAYWIPVITLKRKIHGTTYIVSGSYEGTECFTRKLERIMARKEIGYDLGENAEESHDRTAEI